MSFCLTFKLAYLSYIQVKFCLTYKCNFVLPTSALPSYLQVQFCLTYKYTSVFLSCLQVHFCLTYNSTNALLSFCLTYKLAFLSYYTYKFTSLLPTKYILMSIVYLSYLQVSAVL